MRLGKLIAVVCISLLLPTLVWAALPLITDDTGTQGKGKSQIEVAGEYDRDRGDVVETDYAIAAVFTYGISDPMDLFLGAPYTWIGSSDPEGGTTRANGLGDTVIGAKWRFWENQAGISMGLKPFVTLPTGNDQKTLGNGRIGGGLIFLTSAESKPWSMHFNLGYLRNENTLGDRQDLWHISLAAVYSLNNHWKVCADLGAETSTDRTSEREPRYLLGGFIYAPAEDLELSLGIKQGINDEETDVSVIPGITYRF